MIDLIEMVPGHTNKMMMDQCALLKKVVTATKEVKSGRGKEAEIIKVLRYSTDKRIMDRILNSFDHYRKLYLEEIGAPLIEGLQFRDYQVDIIKNGSLILKKHRFLYLAMEVRTGKTLTSLGIADKVKAKEILFITKKKAISSIEKDYELLNPSYNISIINYESLHLVMHNKNWDLIVCDEAHGMGAFPKPSQRSVLVRALILKCNPMVILLSGTPTPESYSQMYHQVFAIPSNPFSEFKNFYRFCDKYVRVVEKKINGLTIRDYSNGLEIIIKKMEPYTINYTQVEAGFKTEIKEEILEVELEELTYGIIKKLKRDLVVEGRNEVILCDTPVKLMMKIHQLCSGTVKFESGNSMILDLSKAEFIKKRFNGKKIGIFYKFKEEFNALKKVFGDDLTSELSVFEDTNKSIALQIVSGREGISLRKAEFLVYYNIDFSATSYWQSRDRMTTKERMKNQVYWIFSKGGIEYDIHRAVIKKKDYTTKHFEKWEIR